MKNNKLLRIILLIVFAVFSGNSFSQNYYEDSFPELKDSIFYPKIDNHLNKGEYDSTIHIGEQAFDYYYKKNEIERAVYLYNVGMYFPSGSGKGNITLPKILDKISFLQENTDTMNIHYGTTLHIVAFIHKYYYRFDEAKPYIENAIYIYENCDAPQLHLSSAYYNLAGIKTYNNKVFEGYKLFKKALEGFTSKEKVISEYFEVKKLHDQASAYLGIALSMEANGQTELSKSFNLKALEILSENFPKSDNTVVLAANIAGNNIALGNYKEAIHYCNMADSLMKKNNSYQYLYDMYFAILVHKGRAYTQQKVYNKAIESYRNLELQIKKYEGDDNEYLGRAYIEFGNYYTETEKLDSALYFYTKAQKYLQKHTLLNGYISASYARQGKYNLAISFSEKVMVENLKNKNYNFSANIVPYANEFISGIDGAKITANLADYYYKLYRQNTNDEFLMKSIAYSTLSDSLLGRFRDATLIGADDVNIAIEYHDVANTGINACYDAYRKYEDEKYINYFLNFLTQSTAFKLNAEVNQAVLQSENLGTENSVKQIKLLQKIRKSENELLALEKKPDAGLKNEILQKLFEYRIEAFELSFAMQNNQDKLVSKDLFAEIKLKDIQLQMSDREALIAYFVREQKLFSIIIKKNTAKINSKEKDSGFNKSMNSYYKALKTGSPKLKKYASEMYSYLILPFDDELKNVDMLTVIPDGELNQIPFEALVFTENNKQMFLIEKTAVSYNYSIFLWLRSKKISIPDQESFIGFAPVFSDTRTAEINEFNPMRYNDELRSAYDEIRDGNSLKPLPFSEEEVKNVQKLFTSKGKKTKIFLNEDANESNFKKNIGGYSVVHIATHGYSSKKDNELSGLFFYEPETSDIEDITNDGFIYLGEIFNLKPDADLVVLSACKTGSGKIAKGEGVLALPRAFIFAGVPNLVASLWKIHDEKTKNLMIEFYIHILSGKSYSESLRQAKISQIKAGELPIDWSGIILIGR